jgi:hypothetical protein
MASGAEQFGIGKGEAQVFEPIKSNYEDAYKVQEHRAAVRQKKESDVYKSLPTLNKIDILPQHQQIFADKQQDLYDYARKNIGKLREGDAGATMEFQQKISKLQNDANISKNIKDQYEKFLTPDALNKLSDDSIDYVHDFTGYDKETDQFVPLDVKQLKNKVDWVDQAQKHIKVNPVTRSVERYDPVTGQVDSSFSNKTPEAQLDQQIKDNLFGNDEVYSAVLSDYNKAVAKGMTKAQDVYSFYKERVKPGLMVDIQKFGTTKPNQEGMSVGSGSMKNKNFSFAYQKDPGANIQTISIARNDAAENKPLEFVTDEGESIYASPIEYKKIGNQKWVLNVVDKEGDMYSLDASKNAAKMKTNYDVSLDDLKPIIPDVSKSTVKSDKEDTSKKVTEVKRKTKDGKMAVFNAETKSFIRYE